MAGVILGGVVGAVAAALQRLYPRRFALQGLPGNVGCAATLEALAAGADPGAIVATWRPALQQFEAVRAKHLLYA